MAENGNGVLSTKSIVRRLPENARQSIQTWKNLLEGIMSRIRNIKPDFFRHEGLQDLERENAGKYPMFVFEGLWTKSDRQGVFEWKPRMLKLDILPFLDFDMEETLKILLDAGYIRKYEVEGKEYGIIPTFKKHQVISKAEKDNVNVFPPPPNNIETVEEPLGNRPETDEEQLENAGILNSEFGMTENGSRGGDAAPDGSFSQKSNKKPKKPPLREREPVNDMERVEKAYLLNWDSLFTQGRVKTNDPVVNWNQTRSLLKKHFEKLKPDQIIRALKNGMTDDFVLNGGYSLGIMLSAAVLNRLINSAGKATGVPPPSLKEKKSLKGLTSWT
jgi:hypothetical protein